MTLLNPKMEQLMIKHHLSESDWPFTREDSTLENFDPKSAAFFMSKKTPIFVIGDFSDYHTQALWHTNKKSWEWVGFKNFHLEQIDLGPELGRQLFDRTAFLNVEFGNKYPIGKMQEMLAHVIIWRKFLKDRNFAPYKHIIVIQPHHYLSVDIPLQYRYFDVMGLGTRYNNTDLRIQNRFIDVVPAENVTHTSYSTAPYILSGNFARLLYNSTKNNELRMWPEHFMAMAIAQYEELVDNYLREQGRTYSFYRQNVGYVFINNQIDEDAV